MVASYIIGNSQVKGLQACAFCCPCIPVRLVQQPPGFLDPTENIIFGWVISLPYVVPFHC